VLARAAEVLEDEAAATAWIQRDIRSLGGVSPLSLLDTEAGVDLVMDTLARIEYGIAA
jgi:putative toxin-antitoxin system antitoxin component (TIGR02293 family)